MFKSFLISMFAILLFTLGAAASWFYAQSMGMGQDAADEDTLNQPAFDSATETDPVPKQNMLGNGGVLPAVLRGPDLNAEEMFRLSTVTAAKRKQLEQYEERLREHKLRIKAADADTKSAQREIEGALGQVRSIMDATETLLQQTKDSMTALKKEQIETGKKSEELKKLETDAGASVEGKVKNFAEFLQSMPPEDAAETLKEITNNGKMDFAIQLLQKIEARNVSKILAEIKDPPLVAEIASRFAEGPVTR